MALCIVLQIYLVYADLVDRFRARLNDDPTGPSDAVAAIGTLLDLIKRSKGKS